MEGLTLKKAMKKGKAKLCSTEKCSQISKNLCEKCSKPSCKFHMCSRIKSGKKIKICDKCNYIEIKEQIEVESQKEKKMNSEKLLNIMQKNNESIEEARLEERKILELTEKIEGFQEEIQTKEEVKMEEIRKEQYMKEKNLQMLANLKAAMMNSSEIINTENEKLVQVKSVVSTLRIDINQLDAVIKDEQTTIRALKDSVENSIPQEKLTETLCTKCAARVRGISFIKTMSVIQSAKPQTKKYKREENESCSRCRIS